jgi:hypothetical protein
MSSRTILLGILPVAMAAVGLTVAACEHTANGMHEDATRIENRIENDPLTKRVEDGGPVLQLTDSGAPSRD